MLFNILLLFSLLSGIVLSDTDCPIVLTPPKNRRPNESSNFKIVQYNVEWLFIDYYANADCPGNGCSWSNSSEAATHMNYVANIINDLNPDIVNFCEVEGCDELDILLSKVADNTTYNPYLKKGTDTATGQNVGMITRIDPNTDLKRTEEKFGYPISGSKCGYTGTPSTTGVSKHYFTEYYWYGKNVLFIGAHLKAFPTDYSSCAQREAQAQILQNLIFEYYSKGYEIIVLGDFNDYDAEVMDANNNKPTSHVLDILKGSFGTYAGKYELKTVEEKIPQNKRFSDWWDKNDNCVSTPDEFTLIDHILLTPFLNDKILDAYIYQGYTEFCDTYNSDHYPMVIELDGNI